MPQDARSSAEKLRSTAPRLLAASVFLASILTSLTNGLAKDHHEVIAIEASTGRLLWRYKPWFLASGYFEMHSAGLVFNPRLVSTSYARHAIFLDPNTGNAINPFELQSSKYLARSSLTLLYWSAIGESIRLENGWEASAASAVNTESLQFVEGAGGKVVWEMPARGLPLGILIKSWKNFVFSAFDGVGEHSKGIIHAYEAGTTGPSWTLDLNQIVSLGENFPMYIEVIGDALYVQAKEHLFILEPKTGKVVRHQDLAKDLGLRLDPSLYHRWWGWTFCRILFAKPQNLVVIFFDDCVVALDAGAMKYLWYMAPDALSKYPPRVYPLLYGGKVFLRSGDKRRIYQAIPDARTQQGQPTQTFRELDWHDAPLRRETVPPFLSSVMGHESENVHKAIDAGADVNIKDRDGATALHLLARWHPASDAVARQQVSLLKRLIKAGAKIDAGIETGITPLTNAIRSESHQLALELIKAGAKVTYRKGVTCPLHLYDALGSPALVRALIAAGADVNARDAEGTTPLHQALRHWTNLQNITGVPEKYVQDAEQVVRMLVAAGGDVSIEDKYGQDPVEYACPSSRQPPGYEELRAKVVDFMESLKKDAKPKPPNRPAQPAPNPGPPAPGGSAKPAEVR